jgi:hypothetical protein
VVCSPPNLAVSGTRRARLRPVRTRQRQASYQPVVAYNVARLRQISGLDETGPASPDVHTSLGTIGSHVIDKA